MVAFYGNLATGVDIAEALRLAKVQWIEQAGPDVLDPLPWAAFVLIGNGDLGVPIEPPSRRFALLLLGAGAALIAVTALTVYRSSGQSRISASSSR